jgi:predicted amidophosphoribosyltransferase
MCFRPAQLTKPIVCSNCGKKITPMSGMKMTKCPYCKTDFPEETIPCPECGVEQPITQKVCANCGFNGKPGSGDPAKRKQS